MLWTMKKAAYRTLQAGSRIGVNILDLSEPALLKGAGSIKKLPEAVKERNIEGVLIVTDKVIESLHMLDGLLGGLDEHGIKYSVYSGVQPNPTIENIEEARGLYIKNSCGAFIAFGGGSPMDCAKMAAARVANPHKSVREMKGLLKVTHKLPPLFAVPTTAGTGSEATIVAVVTDTATHEKYAVTDDKLRPVLAVLDPELTTGMPPKITSTTGMDALTHAVESYVGQSNTKKTVNYAEAAVGMIFGNLETAYTDGSDIRARENMLAASYYAGVAFTRAYVGYVHAIAHSLGGLYGTPHGLANAVVLPYVLEYYGKTVHKQLARLAVCAGLAEIGQSEAEKAAVFIAAVKALKKSLDIPEYLDVIKEEDIPLIVKRTLKEGNPLYPVPKIMNEADCEFIIRRIKGGR